MIEMNHKNFMTRVCCVFSVCWVCLFTAHTAYPQETRDSNVYYLNRGDLVPGRMGAYRKLQAPYGTPVDETYFQAVKLTAPAGVSIAGAAEGRFAALQPAPQTFGMQVGQVYRFRVTGIRLHPGVEVYPTVEVIDRTHPPHGQEAIYPILIELSEEDMVLAARGKFVTRVIYIEDPNTALPVVETDQTGQGYYEITPGADPMAVASVLGRPVAILRLGGRAPNSAAEADMPFLYHCPPLLSYSASGSEAISVTDAE